MSARTFNNLMVCMLLLDESGAKLGCHRSSTSGQVCGSSPLFGETVNVELCTAVSTGGIDSLTLLLGRAKLMRFVQPQDHTKRRQTRTSEGKLGIFVQTLNKGCSYIRGFQKDRNLDSVARVTLSFIYSTSL